jgi:hypothetical protein
MNRTRPKHHCRAARDRMALLYYGALAQAESALLMRHIGACPGCSNEWDALRRTLDSAAPETVFPRESEVDWQEFARAIVARARAARPVDRPARRWFHVSARLAAAVAAAVAVVVVAIWSNRPRSDGGTRPPIASLMESAHVMEDRLARRGAARYLSDSRALLVNLVGPAAPCRRDHGEYDITLEKEKSRQLLRRKNLYEGDLLALRDQRLATLLGQLESVLMQVTSLDDCATPRQIHDLREQIEARRILLRIDLVTRQIQGRTDAV